MNIEQIKTAVDAARERQNQELKFCPFCEIPASVRVDFFGTDVQVFCSRCQAGPFWAVKGEAEKSWNNRPAQSQADTALIALWEMMQQKEASDD